jgi:hypothetical protein
MEPMDHEHYGQALTMAFLLGMNTTLHATGQEINRENVLRVLGAFRQVADGSLALVPTDAEMRLAGHGEPPGSMGHLAFGDKVRANIVCHFVNRMLAGEAGGGA